MQKVIQAKGITMDVNMWMLQKVQQSKDLKNYLLTILSDEIRNDQTNQIVLKLKKKKYSILNTNYKDDPFISIDYTSEKYSNRINKRMEQKDIFLKLFKKKSA